MITFDEFLRCHEKALGFRPDPEKLEALCAPPSATLYLVAGPGTGKTACLAARVLKLILVDDLPADGVVATTFTTKAAAELRSRILDWGFHMLTHLENDQRLSRVKRQWASALDVNQIVTGTLDSLCQDMLVRYRDPGVQPPVLIDEFVSGTLLLRYGLFSDGRFRSRRLDNLLRRLDARTSTFGWHLGRKTKVLEAVADRLVHDQVDRRRYGRVRDADERYAREKLLSAVREYREALDDRLVLDYAHLEEEALNRLRAGELSNFLGKVRAVLVDEYQDTNLLQEQLYLELASACGGALTVVGDDDQSLYRFRGATVELFSDFPERTNAAGWKAQPVFLQRNHRSSKRIVRFVDGYARLDPTYQDARAADKPPLQPRDSAPEGVPILGMFRDTPEELAVDLAKFLRSVFIGNGYRLPAGDLLKRAAGSGNFGDAALLASSPREAKDDGTSLLPGLLRQQLRSGSRPVDVFNPRGERLQHVPVVERFGGALLGCLDPDGQVEANIFLPPEARNGFTRWRNASAAMRRPAGLQRLTRSWASRNRQRSWPRNASALELVYAVAHYFLELHDDPEGQVYLEAFTRQLSACEQVSSFQGRVVTDPNARADQRGLTIADHSVQDLLRDFLGPIAMGSVDVNEDLFEDFPRDRLPVLSIHQAKGLEFPLAIVDVGSTFKTAHPGHRFKRFPTQGAAPEAMEDHFRPYSPLATPRRGDVDRAFDDLYRQYFVAFSRARDVLLLVGLTPTLPGGRVPNVATGWTRDGDCPWAADCPFEQI